MSESEQVCERSLGLTDAVGLEHLRAIGHRRGWTPVYDAPAGFLERAQVAWEVGDGGGRPDRSGTVVRYFEEHFSGHRIVSVAGGEHAACERVAGALADDLATETGAAPVSRESVLAELLGTPAPSPPAIVRALRTLTALHHLGQSMGADPGPLDRRYLEAFERHLAHPHRQVRFTAMLAADHLTGCWPQMREPVIARKGLEHEHDYVVDAFLQAEAEGR